MSKTKNSQKSNLKKKVAITAFCIASAAVVAGGGYVVKEHLDKNKAISIQQSTADGTAMPDTPENDSASKAAIDNANAVIFNNANQERLQTISDDNEKSDENTVQPIDTTTDSFKPNSTIDHAYESGDLDINIKKFENNDGKLKLTCEAKNIGTNQVSYNDLDTIVFSSINPDISSQRGTIVVKDNDAQDDKDNIIRTGKTVTLEVTADGDAGENYDIIIITKNETIILKDDTADRDIVANDEEQGEETDAETDDTDISEQEEQE